MSDRAHARQARRAAVTLPTKARIDEAMIERLVRSFCASVRCDAIFFAIFNAKSKDWRRHLETTFAFFSSVALMVGRYHGRPMARARQPVDARHFVASKKALELGIAGVTL